MATEICYFWSSTLQGIWKKQWNWALSSVLTLLSLILRELEWNSAFLKSIPPSFPAASGIKEAGKETWRGPCSAVGGEPGNGRERVQSCYVRKQKEWRCMSVAFWSREYSGAVCRDSSLLELASDKYSLYFLFFFQLVTTADQAFVTLTYRCIAGYTCPSGASVPVSINSRVSTWPACVQDVSIGPTHVCVVRVSMDGCSQAWHKELLMWINSVQKHPLLSQVHPSIEWLLFRCAVPAF